ncbi:MAG: hypothetical protein M3Z32_06375 [Acidobacteriota bacterium]|nr:hypothetical protein [Acidobacteriota bacterium]
MLLRRLLPAAFALCSLLPAQDWTQWGRNPQHSGNVPIPGQLPNRQLADFVSDPFVSQEQDRSGGDLLVHYQAALVDAGDVFMLLKTGQLESQVWNEVRLHWENGQLVEKWRFASDWTPEPDAGFLAGWEPVFHPVLANAFVYVPGAGGSVFKLDRVDGSVVARLNPFAYVDPNIFVAGPLTADASGNIFYNTLQLVVTGDPNDNPWSTDVAGAWLIRVGADGSTSASSFTWLTQGAPAADDDCFTTFSATQLPWPPSPSALPPIRPCGSQRPGLNVAPAIAPDGTIYTISRAHFNDRYSYLVAVNPDLSPKWSASLRDRLGDGCGSTTVPATGDPGGCRSGATPGVDPATNQLPTGRVIDQSSSSPVVAPDGSILYGALTRYNYDRGHLLKFGPDGTFAGAYDFGWDTTPAIYPHDNTYSVILKDNHYDVGSYCGSAEFCPSGPEGPYLITSLTPALWPEWSYAAGSEWCINAPAVDGLGTVYAGNEDGNLYVIGSGGVLRGKLFLRSAQGAAYTPLSLGPDGIVYAQNSGHLFVVGN